MLREVVCPNCGTRYRIPAHILIAHYRCSVCHYPTLWETGQFIPNPTITVGVPTGPVAPGGTNVPPAGPHGVTGVVGPAAPTGENRSNDALLGAFVFGATGAAIAGPPGAIIGGLIGLAIGGQRSKPQSKP